MVRNNIIKILLTPYEIERVKKKADLMSLSLSSYCRMLILNSDVEINTDGDGK